MKQESRFDFVRNLTDIFNAVAELEAETATTILTQTV